MGVGQFDSLNEPDNLPLMLRMTGLSVATGLIGTSLTPFYS